MNPSSDDPGQPQTLIPIKNAVLFPYLLMPLSIGKPGSAACVEAAIIRGERRIVVVAQRDGAVSEPGESDLFTVGTRAVIKGLGRRGDVMEGVAQGEERVAITKIHALNGGFEATVRPLPAPKQREYLLRQQMRAIEQELGEGNSENAGTRQLKDRLTQVDLPEEVRTEADRELRRLEKLPPASPDYHVIQSYLEMVVELPWRKRTEDEIDVARARAILEADHYGLRDVKERILEQLGVLKVNPGAKAPILCFVGPPGVGKTSLGQSIARAMGRKFERMSLGGMHDEAELRGHRRTYIGAMPGRIVQAIRRVGVNNPLLMLDEVDKLGQDFRGDPASALLEILDPEQNRTFRDNYLDLPFDLSSVLFITTANAPDHIPRPLLDRMEMLRLSGYSEEEKIEIAKRYLIPRQLRETGIKAEQLSITPAALSEIIERYTREAGVRQLERTIGRLARKVALLFAEGNTGPVTVDSKMLAEMLGPELFFAEHARKELPPGVATGLAWTETGGEVLYIEAALLPGGRGLILTGQLGHDGRDLADGTGAADWGPEGKGPRRAGLRRIIMPEHNRKDLTDLPGDVRAEMEFVFVDNVQEVLAAAIPELALEPIGAGR